MIDTQESAEVRLGKAKMALAIVAEKFEASEKNLVALNDFGNLFSASDATMMDGIDASIVPFFVRLRVIAKNTVFMQRILCAKVRSIVSGARSSIETDNLLVLSYCTRALFEHCAAAAWLTEKVKAFSFSLGNNSNTKLLDATFKKVEGSLHSLYYNNDGNSKLVHIDTMRESLAERVPDQNDVYARLCDYLHPNYGSNLIVSSGEIGAGVINPNILWRVDDAMYLASIAIISIEETSGAIAELNVEILHFASLMNLASKPGISIANWFSIRAAKPQGDGQSKDTALWFPKARTKWEALQMFYEYMDQQGIEVIGSSIGAIDSDWVFDKMETKSGLFWLRCPMQL